MRFRSINRSQRLTLGLPVVLAAAVTGAAAQIAHADFAYTNITPYISGAVTATPQALNNSDQVVGFYNTNGASSTQMPFVYTPGSGAVSIPVGTAGFNNKALGINDSGLIVGTAGGTGASKAFYYSGGTVTNIAPLPDSTSSTTYTSAADTATAVNNSSVIVGTSTVAAPTSSNRAYAYTSGSVDVGTPFSGSAIGQFGSNSNFAWAVNGSGQIAGVGPATAGSTQKQPYIASPTATPGVYTYTNIGPMILAVDSTYNGTTATTMGLDALGNVSGNYAFVGGTVSNGFFYNAATNTVTKITDPYITGSVSFTGMADVGGVPESVGAAKVVASGLTNHAIVYFSGTMVDLNTIAPVPGYTLTNALAINSNGDIVATGQTSSSGQVQAFLLTGITVPEPASLSLFAVGAISLLARRRAHR
jgi:hypothetical protein